VAVIDLDSREFNTFDEEDARGLEAIASLLSSACDWKL
jgi:putative methionine-R-sulfoxide reductase with GAF domain